MEDEDSEVLDLVNDHDEVVGTILRGEMAKSNYRREGVYTRFVDGFVVNRLGMLWVPTRSFKKFIAPGGMDFSVAEHVLSGESYDEAIVRGFSEELGWKIDLSKLTVLGVLPPTPEKSAFDKLYVLLNYIGADPKLNRQEFSEAEWLTVDEFEKRLLAAKVPQKSSLDPALSMLKKVLHS